MTGFWYAILQTKLDESFSPMIMKLVANTLKVFFKCYDTHAKKQHSCVFTYVSGAKSSKITQISFFFKVNKTSDNVQEQGEGISVEQINGISYNEPPEYGWLYDIKV